MCARGKPAEQANPLLGQQPEGTDDVRAAPEQAHPQGGAEQTDKHQQEAVHAALRQVGGDQQRQREQRQQNTYGG